MTTVNDAQVREILREHRDGGTISRLYATGEITEETIPALGRLIFNLEQQGLDEDAERVADVVTYAHEVGERPPVDGWVGKL
ncbi:hypothetical protein HCJ76_43695 [Streptomyces sp. MC1]|uniref:hypothetical protein n=1 Tax=Streptomyces sp. MC1 TaxID=295105 RepID=UPI0018CBB382|nr:hypothetical protein [Streptomyces sp. MC1]MBG7704790.1 hypothetical protein [Streptomyces sp. MC1]